MYNVIIIKIYIKVNKNNYVFNLVFKVKFVFKINLWFCDMLLLDKFLKKKNI